MLVISPKKKYGFTLAELLSSLLIISLLAVLLFPSFKWMTGHANSARCIANMRTIYSAMAAYTNDGGYWPSVNVNSETDPAASGSQLWYVALVRLGYLPSKKEKRDNRDVLIAKALICPSNKDDPGEPYIYTSSPYPWRSNYAMNFYWGERADASIWSPRVPALGMSYSSAILLIDSKSKAGSMEFKRLCNPENPQWRSSRAFGKWRGNNRDTPEPSRH
jgi:prepilin-type N-terminal cleavage/methylation domain-containing protein